MRRPSTVTGRLLLATGVIAGVLGACGSGERDPVAQPAPGVTTFEDGRFDDLPQYPRSEPLGPRSEKAGVVVRSYKVPGASPEQILEFYRQALEERWNLATKVERLGAGTFRAEWVGEEHRLLVSATRESGLDSREDASNSVVAQYSLTLHPL
jgi:hypothetical protein